MPKGKPNKRYTPEFKIKVVETMHREKLSYHEALRKNLCKFKNCYKSDILERLKNSRSDFLQYKTDTVICQGSLDISRAGQGT